MRYKKIRVVLIVVLMIFNSFISIVNAETPALTMQLTTDTGISSDNISSEGEITVSNIQNGATWKYSINNGVSWNNGSGSTFTLDEGTYPSGNVKIKQTLNGTTSSTTSSSSEIIIAKNSIINGDFQSGVSGFSTDYAISTAGIKADECEEGEYDVKLRAYDVHSLWTTAYDHTNSIDSNISEAQGLYFVANAGDSATDTVWQSDSTVSVSAGDAYRFEAYLMAVHPTNPPALKFQLGDGKNWVDLGTTSANYGGVSGVWHLIYADGKFSDSGSFYIRLLNNNTDTGGNDLGVDDIYFGLRAPSPSASDVSTNPSTNPTEFDTSNFMTASLNEDTGASSSDRITTDGQVNVTGPNNKYRYSIDDGNNWTDVAATTSFNYTFAGDGSKKMLIEQRNANDDGWISSPEVVFTLDETAPTIDTVTVADNVLTLTYNENIDPDNVPAITDFSVDIGGTSANPTALNVSGKVITFDTASTVYDGDTVKLSYTVPGANKVRDIAGNDVASMSEQAVVNNTNTVSYNGNASTSGTAPTKHNKVLGTNLTLATNSGSLVKTNYTFNGWNTAADGSGTSYAVSSSYSTNSSTILYARWMNNYTVSYVSNGETSGSAPSNQTKIEGTTLTVSTNSGNLLKTNYTFDGWNTAADGSGTNYATESEYTANLAVTLYARWMNNYTVSYDSNGETSGNAPSNQTKVEGDTLTLSTNSGNLVKTGYTFDGWNTAVDGSGTNYAAGSDYTVNSALTLYAKWTVIDYNISYDGNTNTGGAVPIDGSTYHITDQVTVSGNTGTLVKDNYVFAGWNTQADGNGTNRATTSTFEMGSSDVTLYAQWTAVVANEPKGDLGGKVKDENDVDLAGVDVRLMKGGTDGVQYGDSVLTDVNGDFSFANIPYGTYSLVATDSDKLVTKAIVIQSETTTQNLDMPAGKEKTVVQIVDETPSVAVGNLDEMFTDADKVITDAAGQVEIKLVVEEKEEGVIQVSADLIKDAIASNQVVGFYFEITMLRTVTGAGADNVVDQAIQPPVDKPVQITIDIPEGLRNKAPYKVVRVHNGATLILPAVYNTILHTLTFEADAFSEYSIVYTNSSSSSSSSSSSKSSSTLISAKVNGVTKYVGTLKETTKDDKKINVITLNDARIKLIYDYITVSDKNLFDLESCAKSVDSTEIYLSGQSLKYLNEREFDISISDCKYRMTLPSDEIDIEQIQTLLETENINDVTIKITIQPNLVIKTDNLNSEHIGEPFGFDIEAYTDNKHIKMTQFGDFIEMQVLFADEYEVTKPIITAMALNEEGYYIHLPTKLITQEGKTYAVFYSLINRPYILVSRSVSVANTIGHWGETNISEMATRHIIEDESEFYPDRAITRADFATFIVRALGLEKKQAVLQTTFSDVSSTNPKAFAIIMSREWGIVSGYPDGTFRPEGTITREEAMIMFANAMELSGLEENDKSVMDNFSDKHEVSVWAYDYVRKVTSAKLFNGVSTTQLDPKGEFTYAQAITAIRNLLIERELID